MDHNEGKKWIKMKVKWIKIRVKWIKVKVKWIKTKDMNNTQNNNNIKKSPPKPKKKNRNRSNVTYFNPPFSLGLKTNIGKQFLSLIDKHFPTNNHLSIALNRHNIKLSYSTTKNMEAIIAAHNRKILNTKKENIDGKYEKCNCVDTTA